MVPGESHLLEKANSGRCDDMKSIRKELWFNIPSRRGFVNITSEVEKALIESDIEYYYWAKPIH